MFTVNPKMQYLLLTLNPMFTVHPNLLLTLNPLFTVNPKCNVYC
jgi:hypothetical protein